MLPIYLFSPIFWLSHNIFCFSKDSFEFGRAHFPVADKNKVHLLPAGINMDVFYDRRILKDDGRLKILIVARMVPFKRYEDLFKAAKSLKDRALFDFVINVRGDGPLEMQLKKMVDDLDLHNDVNFLPPLSNSEMPEKIFAVNDIQILPSINEPIGMVIPEGMACGLPAIVSDTCGCKTYIEDGVNGYIFKTGDYFDLAEKIARFSDRKRLFSFSSAASKTIKDRFDFKKVSEDFYQTVKDSLWP
jgi:glycosyltransferase involved in cell wall biosynthesis